MDFVEHLAIPRATGGFTLIELLVVVAILTAIATTAFGYYHEAAEETKEELARVQLAELANAIQRFRQDTGYYPREGPFALDTAGGAIAAATVPSAAWFQSPANLWQLVEQPVMLATHAQAFLANWDPATRRGWHGPYLRRGVGGTFYADIGDNLQAVGSGDPTLGNALIDVPALPAPRARPPVEPGGYATCASAPTNAACLLDYRAQPGATDSLNAAGRPLLFILDGDDTRVVHFGADGRYGGPNVSDGCLPVGDDLVTCLRR